MTARALPPFDPQARAQAAFGSITSPDKRWRRPDIKSVSLLPNVLAKQQAFEAGAYEAWLVDDEGMVTEGTSSNAWIVTAAGELVTRAADRVDSQRHHPQGRALRSRRSRACAVSRAVVQRWRKRGRRGGVSHQHHVLGQAGGARSTTRAIGDGVVGPLTARLLAPLRRHATEQDGAELNDDHHRLLGQCANAGLDRPRAIIFDWDNTLIDSWYAISDAQNHTLTAFGLEPWTLEETTARVRGSMRESFPALFGARWREAGEVFYRRFTERHMQTLQPLPGAAALLEELHGSGLYLAVVSNKKGDYLRKEAAHLGWDRYFRPHRRRFRRGARQARGRSGAAGAGRLRHRPGSAVWFAGDADIDLECATMPAACRSCCGRQRRNLGSSTARPPASTSTAAWSFQRCCEICNVRVGGSVPKHVRR